MPGSVESQVAVNTDNIIDLRNEAERVRDRLHKLEAGQESVRLLTRQVAELHESLPHLARQAAREAVAEARRSRHADWFANLRTYAAVASAGAALATIIILLILR